MDNNQTQTEGKKKSREQLARQVSLFSIGGVTLLGVVGLILAVNSDKVQFERVSYIYGIIFPLIGTWMGTVLAYYFSKDNFEAANRSVQNLVNKVTTADRLKAIEAKEAWIPIEKMRYLTAEKADEVTIQQIVDFMEQKEANRLPILNPQKVVQYILHKATVMDYIAMRFMKDGIAKEAINKETIADMKKNASAGTQQILSDSKGFIPLSASLLDAKQIMSSNKFIQDVFATEKGSPTNAVVGWITNTIITEKARL